jgi:polyisoprenoid-binding protein YceI
VRMNWKLLGVLGALLASPALADVEKVGDALASFSGKGPAGFRLEGKTNELRVSDDGQKVVFTVPLAKLETGISLRDRHMREKYLEVEKYPDAVLEVPWSGIKVPEPGKTVTDKTKGTMSLHGKTKEVAVNYTVAAMGNTYQVTGTVPLNIKDFDINVPSYLGVTVKPDIETNVAFSVRKR